MKIKIKKIYRKEQDTKYGKKWKMSVLNSDDEVWYGGGFVNNFNKDWKEGQTIDVEISSRDYQGKTYYDIVQPLKPDLGVIMERMEQKLDLLLSICSHKPVASSEVKTSAPQAKPVEDCPPEEVVAGNYPDELPF